MSGSVVPLAMFSNQFPVMKMSTDFCAISVHKKGSKKTPSLRFWEKLPHDNTLY